MNRSFGPLVGQGRGGVGPTAAGRGDGLRPRTGITLRWEDEDGRKSIRWNRRHGCSQLRPSPGGRRYWPSVWSSWWPPPVARGRPRRPPPTTAPSASTGASAGGSGSAVVHLATVGPLGTGLVSRSGLTLYRFTPDGTGKSVCNGTCASTWPPLIVPAGTSHPEAGPGLASAELGVIVRSDGSHQVTFKGMPLYTYSGDTRAGRGDRRGVGRNLVRGDAGHRRPDDRPAVHRDHHHLRWLRLLIPPPVPAMVATSPPTSTPA